MSQLPESSEGSSRPNFPLMEEEMMAFWKKHRIFERSIEERPEQKTFVFFDGPPFATGMPHYGHLLQSTIKDVVPRYWTMQGYRVPRRWGWDCHGLPVENLIEKDLKLNSKRDIETYGVDKFIQSCFSSVMTYASDWKRYVERIGRWVEFDGAYKTMDATYTESVWWAFAELWKKQLIYQDFRVSFFCPRCSTPLSNFEIQMGNSYVDVQDPSVVVKFPVVGEAKTFFLVWTTTPWTLPANVALAVHPDEMYVRVRVGEEIYIFAEKLLSNVLKQFFPLGTHEQESTFEILEKVQGSALEGSAYAPLYPLTEEAEKELTARVGTRKFVVISMGYVSTEEGTGIVHTAPGFGEEDFMASKSHDLPVIVSVDDEGRQKASVPLGAGLKIKDSDPLVMEDLEQRGLMYRRETTMHSVGVCWRCATPLLFKAQPAWFVNVTKLKPKLLEAAKKIQWHPESFKLGRFGKGLEGAPDWCISRTRYWGAPLPVWVCEVCQETQVFGSLKDLESVAGQKVPPGPQGLGLHLPDINNVTVACSCGARAKRIPEVFDCWFESGAMPFASAHYPFEGKAAFEANYPADFIAEGQDQTRGWFYSLHVLSVALFGKPAFKNVIVTGNIMAEDGKKMSKSLRNYPDPWEMMSKLGSDTLRYYVVSSPVIQAESLNFTERDATMIQRALFGTLWNVRAFYLLYAGQEAIELVKPRSMHVLDRWLMSRMHQLTKEMTEAMDTYDLVGATRPLREWVDDLSTWWLRRSRDRMKSADVYERVDALRTLREVMLGTAQLFAPFCPFFADKLYQDFEGAKMSVHLDKWPKADERLIDAQLLGDMIWIRKAATAAHEARVVAKVPVRQPLAGMTVSVKDPVLASRMMQRSELVGLLRDELNVEQVVVVGGVDTGEMICQVQLDLTMTPALKRKGLVREIARQIMTIRKRENFTPTDVIRVSLATEDVGFRDQLDSLRPDLMKEVRAVEVTVGTDRGGEATTWSDVEVEGNRVGLRVEKSA